VNLRKSRRCMGGAILCYAACHLSPPTMKLARPFLAVALLLAVSLGLFAQIIARRPPSNSYGYDASEPSEFYFTRLRYSTGYASGGSFRFRGYRDTWSQDFPRADDDCLIVLR